MATFDTSRTTYGVASFANRSFALLNDAAMGVVAWNDARVTRKALAQLTNRELEDIGLVRGDIDAVATSNLIR